MSSTEIALRGIKRTQPYDCCECWDIAWYYNAATGATYCDAHRMLIEPSTLIRAIRYD